MPRSRFAIVVATALLCTVLASVTTFAVMRFGGQPARRPEPQPVARLTDPPVPKPLGSDNDYLQWNLKRTFPWNLGQTTCVAFSLDGRTVAVGGGLRLSRELPDGDFEPLESGGVCVWDVSTGTATLTVREDSDRVNALLYLLEGQLVIEHSRAVKLIDPRTGAVVRIPERGLFPSGLLPAAESAHCEWLVRRLTEWRAHRRCPQNVV